MAEFPFSLMEPTTFHSFFAILVLTIVWFVWKTAKDNKKQPPKVFGLPFVGYLPFLRGKAFLVLDKLGQQHGGIYRLKIGSKDVLIITDFDVLKEAFQKNSFLGRPEISALKGKQSNKGFVMMIGDEWKKERQFAVKTLYKMGYGNTKMENSLKEEAKSLVEVIRKSLGTGLKIGPDIQSSIRNTISTFLYGKSLPIDSQKRKDIDHSGRILRANVKQITAVSFIPWLAKVLPSKSSVNSEGARATLQRIYKNDISEHEENLDFENPQGYVDEYLKEMKNSGKATYFSKKNLIGNMQLMMHAGIQSTTSTLEWLLVAMAAYPHIQKKVQEEIDRVIGPDGEPTWSDRAKLPYVGAVLLEVQRWRTVIPLSLFHCTTEDTSIRGFYIPKDTVIIPNLWSVHNDPNLWVEPSELRPERFLSENCMEILKKEAFVSFSYGKRSCPGALLAEMQLFFYFLYMMKTFTVSAPDGKQVNQDGYFTVGYAPFMEEFLFTLRKKG